MSLRLNKIENRLDSLEKVVSCWFSHEICVSLSQIFFFLISRLDTEHFCFLTRNGHIELDWQLNTYMFTSETPFKGHCHDIFA